jgi:hypothetical protein
LFSLSFLQTPLFPTNKCNQIHRSVANNRSLQRTSPASTNTSRYEPTTTGMNPAAAGAQEDASTLSSHDTDPVKLRWSKLKAEEKRSIQEVIS